MHEPEEAVKLAGEIRGMDAADSRAASGADLIETFGDLVYNLSVRLTGDREEARDLAQDAFIRIIGGAGSFRGEASRKTWVCQIVINCHRNRGRWWRRLKRGRTVSLDDRLASSGVVEGSEAPSIASTLADPAPGAERMAESGQVRERLQRELTKLPRDQRAALLLREVEGMSYSEISAVMGVRKGTVKSRIARARETLRVALADFAGQGGLT